MNDRFRFRAWNRETKQYHYGAENTYDYMYGLPSVMKCSFGSLLEDTGEGNRYVVEQCTGLKDKNGRLIYDGDLLLLDPDDPPALVVWSEDVAMFCLVQEDVCYTFDNCGYSPQEMEIVGNSHENPELLEDK